MSGPIREQDSAERLTDVELLALGWRVFWRIQDKMESLGADALRDWPTARVLHPVLTGAFESIKSEAKRRAAEMGIAVNRWEFLVRQCEEAGFAGFR